MNNTLAKRNGNTAAGFESMFHSFWPDSLRRFLDGNLWDVDSQLNRGTVPVNMRETADHYELDVIAPGLRKEDLSVKIKHNELTIAFERKEEVHSEQKGWERNEYMLQSFERRFTMDDTVDYERISAAYADGILRLTIPKNDRAKLTNRQIEVQ
ncbi:Hsp20/alpha crystallin family protein [Sediminibacterium roseum]|uniref:Hsp20/alpha crystallin family protein n=1 Tax=Sediminibacterium roseum TaxID=1978412 RepID=A0ABW9ZSN0_9BACT|nr:Hsp20/alpha crystallin family protein [Sediminibacterium roseum]NCI49974.1 Hsp20/alpha crystallin family protein [Sediminibacterium roseum]